MTFTETLHRLATGTETQVLAAFRSWQEGVISQSDLLAVASAYLTAAGNQGAALADRALAAWLSVELGEAVPVLGLLPRQVDHVGQRVGRLRRRDDRRSIPAWTRVLNAGRASCARTSPGTCCPATPRCITIEGVAVRSDPSSPTYGGAISA